MTVAGWLLAYAGVVAAAVPWAVRRADWLERSPAAKLVLLQAASVSVLLAAVLSGFVLATPSLSVATNLADVLHACAQALRELYRSPAAAVSAVVGLALSASVLLRLAAVVVSGAVSTHRARVRHREGLAILGRPRSDLGITVVTHSQSLAYCVPGRGGRIVLTSAALDLLDPAELHAVLAHERAHLGCRHHLAVAGAGTLVRAFPWLPLFRLASDEAERIVELLADDAAARAAGRAPVAAALLALADAPGPPVAALAVAGPSTRLRAGRLLSPVRPLRRVGSATVVLVGLLVLAAPVVLVSAPAVAAVRTHLCPVDRAGVSGSARPASG